MTRLVVTGERPDGSACILSDKDIGFERLGGGFGFTQLWGSDTPPAFPNDGAAPCFQALMPPAGGYRFSIMQIMPKHILSDANKGGPVELSAAVRDMYANAGIDAVATGEAPGMHRTDSVDLGIVLSGVVTMELDTGEKIELRAGDAFVQNGTHHKWSNEGSESVVVAVAIIGGDPRV
ncbi:cupin domain-containing protein [Sphingopyxis sp. USTB-05]|uniref:cupin domain-containing protein n=1 Tax=Sphingopyxis sp. USTB-05 TaxID=2830667 RepID=UPI002078A2D5|nr:cupin domain-containing protein [Sphingopyxis sp. USTB-05]USI77626.1 cupin domain-containing protein [Sphingopyxis sp. USTB-05]